MINYIAIRRRDNDKMVYCSFIMDEALEWMQKKWLANKDQNYIMILEQMTKEEFDSLDN